MKETNLKYFFTISILLASHAIFAQIGLSGYFLSTNTPDWDPLVEEYIRNNTAPAEEINFYSQGFSFGVDYWFRLKNIRIEFLPELNYSRFEENFQLADQNVPFTASSNLIGLFFNVNFYPFDFYGDCDCPTFSKSDPIFKKGFFLQLAPRFISVQHRTEIEDQSTDETAIALGASIGAGLDIGLTDLVTISPIIRYSKTFNSEWSDLESLISGGQSTGSASSDIDNWEFGLRLGLRFDQ